MALVGMRAGLFYKFGYVDEQGRQIECRYDMAEPFEDGVACVSTATWIGAFVIRIADVGCTCRHDYISRTGESISKSPVTLRYPVPLSIGETYHDGMQPRGRVIYVLGNGRRAFDAEFDDGLRFREGLAAVQSKGKWGFIDPSGRFAIKPQFDGADSFSGGLAVVRQGKVRAFIDPAGHPRVLGSFEEVSGFAEGVAAAKLGGRWGFI